jgi:hypothetical protein
MPNGLPDEPTPYDHSSPAPEIHVLADIAGVESAVTFWPIYSNHPSVAAKVATFYRIPLHYTVRLETSDGGNTWSVDTVTCRERGASARTMKARVEAALLGVANQHSDAIRPLLPLAAERSAARALRALEDARRAAAAALDLVDERQREFDAHRVPAERAAIVADQLGMRRGEGAPDYVPPRISDRLRFRLLRMARFWPMTRDEPASLPALQVAGVWTFAYLDERTKKFRVSIHLEDAHRALVSSRKTVPLRVDVGDTTVFDGPLSVNGAARTLFDEE